MNNKVKAQVVGAYFEPTRNLNFKASAPVSVKDAVTIMTLALDLKKPTQKGYNEFSPSLLATLPKGSKVTLAREGSVCAYVKLPDGDTTDLSAIRALTKADECSFSTKAGDIRLWWD
jgi:hypothetical protein